MPKLHIATSKFIDPIIILEHGVNLVRPYAAAELLGITSDGVKALCDRGMLPFIWDGETKLIFIDHRDFGKGGKFSFGESRRSYEVLSMWKGRLICPVK